MHVYLQCLSFSTISKWQQFNSNLIVKKRTRSQSSIATKRKHGTVILSVSPDSMTEVHADNPVDLFSHNKDALGYIQV